MNQIRPVLFIKGSPTVMLFGNPFWNSERRLSAAFFNLGLLSAAILEMAARAECFFNFAGAADFFSRGVFLNDEAIRISIGMDTLLATGLAGFLIPFVGSAFGFIRGEAIFAGLFIGVLIAAFDFFGAGFFTAFFTFGGVVFFKTCFLDTVFAAAVFCFSGAAFFTAAGFLAVFFCFTRAAFFCAGFFGAAFFTGAFFTVAAFFNTGFAAVFFVVIFFAGAAFLILTFLISAFLEDAFFTAAFLTTFFAIAGFLEADFFATFGGAFFFAAVFLISTFFFVGTFFVIAIPPRISVVEFYQHAKRKVNQIRNHKDVAFAIKLTTAFATFDMKLKSRVSNLSFSVW